MISCGYLWLILGLFPKCSGVFCYFCTTPKESTSEYCMFYAGCPRNSPGCVTLELEESHVTYVVRSCSFPEKCNSTVASYKHPRIVSCNFCEGDLCNSGSATRFRNVVYAFAPVLIRMIV